MKEEDSVFVRGEIFDSARDLEIPERFVVPKRICSEKGSFTPCLGRKEKAQ